MMGAGNWKPNEAEGVINECSTERNNVHPELSYLHVFNPRLKFLKIINIFYFFLLLCHPVVIRSHGCGAAWLNRHVMEPDEWSIDTFRMNV